MNESIKPGRPRSGESRSKMKMITFRIDEETLAALRKLEVTVGPKVRGRMSYLLRKLILDAHARLGAEHE